MYHLSLFFLTIGLIKTNSAKSNSSHKPYIHGGQNVRIEEFPWAAYVRTSTSQVSSKKVDNTKENYL